MSKSVLVNIIAGLIVYMIGSAVVYAGFAFTTYHMDPINWSDFVRFVFVVAEIAWAYVVVEAVISDD